MDVHQEAMAVASVAQAQGAEGIALGTSGTRLCALDKRLRPLRSKSQQLISIYDAGPCGCGRSRDLMKQGAACGVVAPSGLPKQAGDWVTTDRRDAMPLARLRRVGDLTPVDVPTVADDAIRDSSRAREETLRELKAATWRLKAFVLRHALRSPRSWAPGPPAWAQRGGLASPSQAIGPHPAPM